MKKKPQNTPKKPMSFRLDPVSVATLHRFAAAYGDHHHIDVSATRALEILIGGGASLYGTQCAIPNRAWAISRPYEGEPIDSLRMLIMAWHEAILGPDMIGYIQAEGLLITRLNAHKNVAVHYGIECMELTHKDFDSLPELTRVLNIRSIVYDHGRSLPADDNARIAILRQIWAAADADGVVHVREPITGPYLDPIGRLPDRYAHKDAWVRQQRRG